MIIKPENERRWLMRDIPDLGVEWDAVQFIRQTYIPADDKMYRMRTLWDLKGDKHNRDEVNFVPPTELEFLYKRKTEKGEGEEVHLLLDGANEFLKKATHQTSKVRYVKELIVFINGETRMVKVEIDEFDDARVIIMEVELPFEDMKSKIEFPYHLEKEVLVEVTEISGLSSYNLSKKL